MASLWNEFDWKNEEKAEDGGGGETLSDILLKEDTILNDFMPFPM